MRLTFVLMLAGSLLFASCSKNKDKDGDVLIPDTPRTEVPALLVGKWLNGTFSMSNWWSYDRKKYEGNPYSSSRAFVFSQNGDAEFFQIIKTNNGSCSEEGLTYFKGTVAFDESDGSFTMYPGQGTMRGYYSCASNRNFHRSAKLEELKPIKLYVGYDTDNNGVNWMITAHRADAPETEWNYFRESNW